MSGRLAKYQVRTPEYCIGHVIGELCRIGAWLDELSERAPVQTIYARVPVDAVPAFERWLTEISRGEGSITGGEPANDEDA